MIIIITSSLNYTPHLCVMKWEGWFVFLIVFIYFVFRLCNEMCVYKKAKAWIHFYAHSVRNLDKRNLTKKQSNWYTRVSSTNYIQGKTISK